jgi:small-conductance mechanosensitive channel
MAAVIALAPGVPLIVVPLVIVIGTTPQDMMALIVLLSVVTLIFGMAVRQIRENRTAGKTAVPK